MQVEDIKDHPLKWMTWFCTGPQDYIVLQSWIWQLDCDAPPKTEEKGKGYVFLESDEKRNNKSSDLKSRHGSLDELEY